MEETVYFENYASESIIKIILWEAFLQLHGFILKNFTEKLDYLKKKGQNQQIILTMYATLLSPQGSKVWYQSEMWADNQVYLPKNRCLSSQ